MNHEGWVYAACSFRCFGFILSLPFGEALNTFSRFLLAVGLGVALVPLASGSVDLSPLSLVVEFAIGCALGAPLRFLADVSEMVGELIDTARGQTISSVIDPLHGQGTSDLAVIMKNGAVVLALSLGALEVSLGGLTRSFQAIPLGAIFSDASFARGLTRSLSFLLIEGLRVCAVWMGAFLMIDLCCALAARLLSGLSFAQSAAILKMLATFILLMVVLREGGRLSINDVKQVLVPWRDGPWRVGLPPGGGSP